MEQVKMTWSELCAYIYAYNTKHQNTYNDVKKHLVAAAVFSNDNPDWGGKTYSLKNRTYTFGNDDKYWYSECGGSSIFASCPGEYGLVRLDWYIHDWKVEYCYIVSEEK